MPQDSPATAAGTEKGNAALLRKDADQIDRVIDNAGALSEPAARLLEPIAVRLRGIARELETPESWAPVNRRSMRDDVDRFRNQRMPVPRTLRDALELAAIALEYYEHAQEVSTRTVAAYQSQEMETDTARELWTRVLMGEPMDLSLDARETGAGGRAATSRTAAEKIVDTVPAMVKVLDERHAITKKKAEAEKELGVARRRHATAITFAHAYTFASVDALNDPNTVAAANSVAAPDTTAGDSDAGSLAEVK